MYKYTDKEIENIIKNAMIIVDTREQKNQHITNYFDKKGIKWCNMKLDHGDYSIKVESPAAYRDFYLTDIISIERKANLEELSGNLTHNRDRFTAEFQRAKGKMYLLIENANYEDIEHKRYNTQFNNKSFRASLDAFEQRYNLHVHYQKDISASGYFIHKTLTAALREELKKGTF